MTSESIFIPVPCFSFDGDENYDSMGPPQLKFEQPPKFWGNPTTTRSIGSHGTRPWASIIAG